MPFFAPTQEEERSFLSVLRHTVLDGPLRLVRFTDSSRGHKAAYGRKDPKTGLYASYWMYASEVEELLESVSAGGPYGLKTIREVSVRWAICDDWGDLTHMGHGHPARPHTECLLRVREVPAQDICIHAETFRATHDQ
jgi:hypothetical protein